MDVLQDMPDADFQFIVDLMGLPEYLVLPFDDALQAAFDQLSYVKYVLKSPSP